MLISRRFDQTEPQDRFLKLEAERLGITVAELLRRIIDWYRDTTTARKEPTP